MEQRKEKELIDGIKRCRELLEIQSHSVTDEYMKGLYNGMELIISVLEHREPVYWGSKMSYDEECEKQELTLPDHVAAQVAMALYKIYQDEMSKPQFMIPSFESWLEKIIERGQQEEEK